jgi:hypothetical protein
LVLHAASLKLAAPSGQYIPDPPTLSSIGKRDKESVWCSKNIDRRPVELARLSTEVGNNSEAGQLSGKPDGDLVRYSSMKGRHRPLTKPNKNDENHQDGRSETIDAAMTMADCLLILYISLTACSIAAFESLANFL